jgi:hypothetical protein
LALLRSALELDVNNPLIRNTLVCALVEQARLMVEQDWRASAPLLQQALDLDPGNEPALALRKLVTFRHRTEAPGGNAIGIQRVNSIENGFPPAAAAKDPAP